jgi:BON domain
MSRLRIVTAASAACLAALIGSGVARAQSTSLFGSGGPTASSAGRTASTSTFGRSATGLTGLSATGGSQGRTGTGTSAFGSQTGLNTGATGTGSFVGRGNSTGAFVGQQNAGQTTGGRNAQTSTFRGVNRTNANTRGGTANRGGQFGASQFGGGQGAAPQTRDAIRPVTVVAFNYPRHVVARVNTAVVARFARIAARSPQLQGVSTSLSGNFEVVLTGTVDSESTKTLAENLARMEPGVQHVRNQLVVRK